MITYNHESFIREAIEGVLMQKTSFPFQLIIGEDCSTDNTWEICKKYEKKHPELIKLIPQPDKNLGMMPNFIRTLNECKGKYIALCEGDDYWTDPLKLQKQVDFLEGNEEYSICFHDVKIFDQTSNKLINDFITRDVDETTTIKELAKGNYIHTPSVILRNNFTIPDWFKESPLGDWILYIIAIKIKKIKKLAYPMGVYRIHNTSVWSGLSQEIKNDKTITSIELVLNNLRLKKEIENVLQENIKTLSGKISIVEKLKGYLKILLIKRKMLFHKQEKKI